MAMYALMMVQQKLNVFATEYSKEKWW